MAGTARCVLSVIDHEKRNVSLESSVPDIFSSKATSCCCRLNRVLDVHPAQLFELFRLFELPAPRSNDDRSHHFVSKDYRLLFLSSILKRSEEVPSVSLVFK